MFSRFYFKVQATDGKFVQEVPVTIYVIVSVQLVS